MISPIACMPAIYPLSARSALDRRARDATASLDTCAGLALDGAAQKVSGARMKWISSADVCDFRSHRRCTFSS